MIASSRRSVLQVRILKRLEAHPTKSIAQLAEGLQVLRPSVSRSLHSLKEEGLVEKRQGAWRLTDQGEAEVAAIAAKVAGATAGLESAAKRTLTMLDVLIDNKSVMGAVTEAARHLEETFKRSRLVQFEALKSTQALVAASAAFAAPSREVLKDFLDGLSPLLDAQKRNAELVNYFAASFRHEEFAKSLNLSLAGTIDNILAVCRPDLRGPTIDVAGLRELSRQATEVSRSFANVFAEHSQRITADGGATLSRARIASSTSAVNNYSGSIRLLIDNNAKKEVKFGNRLSSDDGDETLDRVLDTIHPDLVAMRRGSWEALRGGHLDHLRHAATSQRELVVQVLRQVVPNLELPKGLGDGPQVKARIKIALGDSDSDAGFVEVMARAVVGYYSQLNKYTHENRKNKESLRAIMRAGEGLIAFVLANVDAARLAPVT